MATALAMDDRLLDQARTVAGRRTTRETVNEALRDFIYRRQRLALADLAERIEYDPKYDDKRKSTAWLPHVQSQAATSSLPSARTSRRLRNRRP